MSVFFLVKQHGECAFLPGKMDCTRKLILNRKEKKKPKKYWNRSVNSGTLTPVLEACVSFVGGKIKTKNNISLASLMLCPESNFFQLQWEYYLPGSSVFFCGKRAFLFEEGCVSFPGGKSQTFFPPISLSSSSSSSFLLLLFLFLCLSSFSFCCYTSSCQLQPASYMSLPACFLIIIIIYIYHALIDESNARMIHINRNTILYTHVEHSLTNAINVI